MIKVASKDLDPLQRGFSLLTTPFKPLRETAVGKFLEAACSKPFQYLEGAGWAYFVYDGVSKVNAKYQEKTFYQKTQFQTLDTFSNELYLLANSVKFVFWLTTTTFLKAVCTTISPVVQVASAVADVFYVYVYGAWMFDDAVKAEENNNQLESGKNYLLKASDLYDSKSVISIGDFSSNYCYAMYSGLSVASFIVGGPPLLVVSGVCLIGFLGFGILTALGEISHDSSNLTKEHVVHSIPRVNSHKNISI